MASEKKESDFKTGVIVNKTPGKKTFFSPNRYFRLNINNSHGQIPGIKINLHQSYQTTAVWSWLLDKFLRNADLLQFESADYDDYMMGEVETVCRKIA